MIQQLVQQTQQASHNYQMLLQQEQQNAQRLEELAHREQRAAQMIQTALQGHQTAIQQLHQVSQLCRQIEHSAQQQVQASASHMNQNPYANPGYAQSNQPQQFASGTAPFKSMQ
ncbi:hypothetical protein ACF3MZ_08285 [Paenibacillaceae bacterium WGS1546]|uniref:hypothetical protein n=1 Tax=Cohnella sp. WGS1546 TaxID=3366810 RepID=UPI00372D082D